MPLEEFTFFIDRSLGAVKLAQALRAIGLTVVIHDDLFPTDAPDQVWLTRAGAEGWVVLTKDDKIRYRALERDAYIRSKVRCFVFSQGRQSIDVVIDAFGKGRRRMEQVLEAVDAPFVASVTVSGSVTVLAPAEKRRAY